MEEENKDEIKEQKPETPVGDEKKDEEGKDPEPAPEDPLKGIKEAYEKKLEDEKKKQAELEKQLKSRNDFIAELIKGENPNEAMPSAFEEILERRKRQRKF